MAERTGLIVPIGEWALRAACAQNRALQDAGLPPLSVAVNLSARQFQQENLVEMVGQALKETGMDPRFPGAGGYRKHCYEERRGC